MTRDRAARIDISREGGDFAIAVRRPRKPVVLAYEALMWAPLVGLMVLTGWLLASNAWEGDARRFVIVPVLVLCVLLYAVLGMLTLPGWSRRQRISINDAVLRKQYPVGPLDSLGLPVQLDLSRYSRCEAIVLRVKGDDKHDEFRPAFRDRVCLLCNGQRTLWMAPSLTREEAGLVADALNDFLTARTRASEEAR